MVSQLAGELDLPQRLVPTLSESEPTSDEPSSGSTPAQPCPGDSPVDLRVVRAYYVPLMIPVRIGDITFPRVLVDAGSGVNVMSNQIRIKLGYHRMAPSTTKLAMADNTLVWPVGVLTAIPIVVEGVCLIVSFQVIEMDDPDCT
ncbi:hypothetical protein R1flu_014254 [Riccia fluitans]|uniref:Uncharacterized protein n=1 Tax=Riccia fluitans TaxID=41844 RepID=A0ABD1YFK1_9MARC